MTTLTGGVADTYSIRADQVANAAACRQEARWVMSMVPVVEHPSISDAHRADLLATMGVETDLNPFRPIRVDEVSLLSRVYSLIDRATELDTVAYNNSAPNV